MSIPRIQIPRFHPAQTEIHKNLNRFNVLDCGRRFGKDIMERNYAIEGIASGNPVAWYEPEYKSLMGNWIWMCNTLAPITSRKSEVEKRIDVHGGGSIEMWSLQDKDASRGRHYKRVVINEAAKMPNLRYSWDTVIRITLADLKGGAMIGSTPRGRNYFWELYQRGLDDKEPEWSSWQYTTYDNPYIAKSEIDEMRRSLPEITSRQEILAEFIDDQGGVFRRVQSAIQDGLDEPKEGRQYTAGVDVAASIDYTVVSVMDVEAKRMVFMDRFNRVDYPVLENRLAALYERWNLTSMTVEANSIGRPVIDHLVEKGLPVQAFTTTNATKQVIIQSLQSAFEHEDIKIIDDPVLIGELLSFEGSRTPSGAYKYSAPSGMHDDTVMSLAIAWNDISGDNWLMAGSDD